MKTQREYNYLPDCVDVRIDVELFSIPEAAALWCGVKQEDLSKVLSELEHIGKGVYEHPTISCMKIKTTALYRAIEQKKLIPVREYGGEPNPSDHVAYERRHFYGRELKQWISETYPNDKPTFLFGDIKTNLNTTSSKTTNKQNEVIAALACCLMRGRITAKDRKGIYSAAEALVEQIRIEAKNYGIEPDIVTKEALTKYIKEGLERIAT